LVELLGEGGYGKVYSCLDYDKVAKKAVPNSKPYAVKIPLDRGVDDMDKEAETIYKIHK
jgi:serine/threonine protein kinase